MLTTPILISVAVTPRNDAVSTGAAVVAVVAGDADAVVGGADVRVLLLALLQAPSDAPTTTSTAINDGTRERPISPPLHPPPRNGPGCSGKGSRCLLRRVEHRRQGLEVAFGAQGRVEHDEAEP